jgi:hypothetical protein
MQAMTKPRGAKSAREKAEPDGHEYQQMQKKKEGLEPPHEKRESTGGAE